MAHTSGGHVPTRSMHLQVREPPWDLLHADMGPDTEQGCCSTGLDPCSPWSGKGLTLQDRVLPMYVDASEVDQLHLDTSGTIDPAPKITFVYSLCFHVSFSVHPFLYIPLLQH